MQCKKDYMGRLPTLKEAKMIIIDEGSDAMYARILIAGWIHTWIENDHNHRIDILSFCDPKSRYNDEPEPLTSKNVRLHDYYTIDVNKVENNDTKNLEHILAIVHPTNSQNTVIIDCLSSLVLYVGLAKALRFIERLSTQVPQLVCIYRRNLIQRRVPAIETLGTTYVKLEKSAGISCMNNLIYTAKLIHRKPSGSVICQTEIVTQDRATFHITSEKLAPPNTRKMDRAGADRPLKIESSFRIEINAHEMEQRDMTPLPYIINATNTSKIHYQPDDEDDIDEDDPDDDLCF